MDKKVVAGVVALIALIGLLRIVVGRQTASNEEVTSRAAEERESESSPEKTQAVTEDFFEVPTEAVTQAFLLESEPVSFSTGGAGEVVVVDTGRYDQQAGLLPVVLRNNTEEPVIRPTVTGTALDGSGSILGSGEDQILHPNMLVPEATAIGYVYFGGEFPKGTTFELDVEATPVSSSDAQFENIRDLV